MLKRIVPLVLALVLCAGLAQAKTKAPATQLPGDLTLAEAQKVLDAALVKAKAQGVPMNIAIVDAGGNLKAFVRQDGAFIGSIDVSTKKAVTARYFNMPTSTLGAASQPGQELFGIEATNGGLVIFGGGELLIRDNVIVGAIGVSGGSVAEDTNVAKAGEPFTIYALLRNNGADGFTIAQATANGEVVAEKIMTVEGGSWRVLQMDLTLEAGEYTIEVGGLTGTITVTE